MCVRHIPVLREEVVGFLAPGPGKVMVDCTLGGGGHSLAILERMEGDGLLIGLDRDPDAVSRAAETLRPFGANVRFFHDNYSRLREVLDEARVPGADGLVADLGVSAHQMLTAGRGFSFQHDTELDMRMDPHSDAPTAAHLVNTAPETTLADLFFQYGEERLSRRIARSIVRERAMAPIATTGRLAEIISAAYGQRGRAAQRIHPATRVFQALRIAVNDELGHLERFLGVFCDCLEPGGRAAVISFHSLEDRLVKQRFKALASGCTCPPGLPVCGCGDSPRGRLVTRKAVRPTEAEVRANPMARSARLRVFEKNQKEAP